MNRFRRGTALAVALTAILLFLWGAPDVALPDEPAPAIPPPPADPAQALEEASHTIRELLWGFYAPLPKLLIALAILLLAWGVASIARLVIHRTLGRWERKEALSAIARIVIFLIAISAALSVVAGDARALIGSLGLVGLALSWALQTPIESFTGWLMNSFRAYYRVGDRIEVGEVFGDVYKIDVLTTTVWEAGGPGKSVAGAQSTGAMITFPNWEVLRSNIVNYSRDFPYVWDEVTLSVANESDFHYTIRLFEDVARKLFGEQMMQPAEEYRRLLERAQLAFDVAELPKVYLSAADQWTNCTVRYLVPARERRRWSSDLLRALLTESNKPEHMNKVIPAFNLTRISLQSTSGEAR